jgi:hypothetical protein
VAHAVKGDDGEKEGDVDAAGALRHAVAPWERQASIAATASEACIATAAPMSLREAPRRKKNDDAAAALPHAVAFVGAPSVCSCGGAEERKGCDCDAAATFAHAVAPVGAPSAAAARLYGDGEVKANRAAARSSVGSVKIK